MRRARIALVAAGLVIMVTASTVRHESWEALDLNGGTTSRSSGWLLPWQDVTPPAGGASVRIRKRALLGLYRCDYQGPAGLMPGTGAPD